MNQITSDAMKTKVNSITTVFTLIFIASDVMIMLKNEIVHSKKRNYGNMAR